MKVTIEKVLDDPVVVEEFLELYRSAFDPLDTVAAGRQALTDDEFRADMGDESVLKFVGRDRDGRPVALCLLATDVSKLPWLSPAFWQQRYPEQFARNAIFYVGAILVSPRVRGGLWFHRLLTETIGHAASHRGVGALDVCRYNAEHLDLPGIVAKVSASMADVECEQVDVQTYHAYVYSGLKPKAARRRLAEIDLREPAVERADAMEGSEQ
jgi:hypothetical protein